MKKNEMKSSKIKVALQFGEQLLQHVEVQGYVGEEEGFDGVVEGPGDGREEGHKEKKKEEVVGVGMACLVVQLQVQMDY